MVEECLGRVRIDVDTTCRTVLLRRAHLPLSPFVHALRHDQQAQQLSLQTSGERAFFIGAMKRARELFDGEFYTESR